MMELSTVLLYWLCWMGVTGMVSFGLHLLMRREILPPGSWWDGLFVSLVIFVPIPFIEAFDAQNLNWISVHFDVSSTLLAEQLSYPQVMTSDAISQHLFLLGLGIVVAISMTKLMRLFQGYSKVNKLVQDAIPFNPETSLHPTFVTQMQTSAFVTGVTRPVVALPTYFLNLSKRQQEILLAHEYTHIQNKDHISILLWRILNSIFWFNPCLKWLESGFRKSIELRCDKDTVLNHTFSPKEYAHTLLTCLKLNTHSTLNELSVAFIASSFSMEDHKRRITNIINQNNLTPGHQHMSGLMLVLLCMAIGVNSALASALDGKATFETDKDLQWIYPVAHPKVSSVFGNVSPIRGNKPHKGVDLVASTGTPVYASASGKVLIADDDSISSGYGLVIVLQHQDQWQSMYAHLSAVTVTSGETVQQGDVIGYIGATGRATGPHLHFELAYQGKSVDPLPLLNSTDNKDNLM